MKTICQLRFKNHLGDGKILTGDSSQDSKTKTFDINREIDTSIAVKVLSLTKLPAGIKNGLVIDQMMVDGIKVDPRKHTRFKMVDNPFIENRDINESNLVFNGDLYIDIDEPDLFWFPYFYSNKKIDFVFQNNLASCQSEDGCWEGEPEPHRDEKLNVPFDPRINFQKGDHIALGCSVTYGTSLPKTKRWPDQLGLKNFGVPGLGIDSIYYNAKRMSDIYQPGSITILFPIMARRLLEFESKGKYFRMSCPYNKQVIQNPLDWLKNYFEDDKDTHRDHFWISQEAIQKLTEETTKKIVDDVDYDHSRRYLEKIASLPCPVMVSSWDEETYGILPHYFKNVLPFFEEIDVAKDGQHPGPDSHQIWADSVKSTISSITS